MITLNSKWYEENITWSVTVKKFGTSRWDEEYGPEPGTLTEKVVAYLETLESIKGAGPCIAFPADPSNEHAYVLAVQHLFPDATFNNLPDNMPYSTLPPGAVS